jgi:hypothetical protein
LETESTYGAGKEKAWHEGMSCEGLPYGGICTALKAVVSTCHERIHRERKTAKYGTAPGGVAIHTELKQEGKKKITPTPNDCLHSPKYRHSLCGEPDNVGKDRDAIFHYSNPHGMLPI